jgi:prolyl-tRNA synthetase
MRWSKCFIPTLRESPASAETVAEKLLVRAGFVRAASTGVYGYLPLGMRSFGRIQEIARQEMEKIGGQEVLLGPEDAAAIARGELRSAKQLPQVWFRTGTVTGLDVYWFGLDRAAMESALARTIERCGVAARGWMVLSETGPDIAAVCAGCGYTASLATTVSAPSEAPTDVEGDLAPEEFHTPGQKTIADLARFTGQPESMQMKSLVLVANGKPVLVMLRGDHRLSEAKFTAKSGAADYRHATAEELVKWLGASAGSLGPVDVKTMPVWMDSALAGRRNMVCGANRDDYHLRHVTPGEDFEAEACDLREAAAGDRCATCGGALEVRNAIQLARVRDGVARLALDRLLMAAVEAGNDKDGMILPPAIAPFQVVITAANVDAESVYRAFLDGGIDVLLDDRDERPGVKFKDADLIGVPWRVTVGKKLAGGIVEVVERRSKTVVDVAISDVVGHVRLVDPHD